MGQSILLVDDEPSILKCVRRVLRPLEKKDIVILTSTSAEKAIELIEMHQIDVVVTDENMIGMSGTELLSWITEHSPETKRIVLTGDNSISTAKRAINEGGIDAFLTKPFRNAELIETVLSVIQAKDQETRVQAIQKKTIFELSEKVEELIFPNLES